MKKLYSISKAVMALAILFSACEFETQPTFTGNPLEEVVPDTESPIVNELVLSSDTITYGQEMVIDIDLADNGMLSEATVSVVSPLSEVLLKQEEPINATAKNLSYTVNVPFAKNLDNGSGKVLVSVVDADENHITQEVKVFFQRPEIASLYMLVEGGDPIELIQDEANPNLWVVVQEIPEGTRFIVSTTMDESGLVWSNSAEGTVLGSGEQFTVEKSGKYTVSFDTYSFEMELLTPYPQELYLVGGSSAAGWAPESALPFTQVSEGVFSIIADLTVSGDGVKFLPTLGSWDGDWGMKEGEPGSLVQEGEANVTIESDGKYQIAVNFVTETYAIKPVVTSTLPDELYLVGGSTPADWNEGNALPFTKTDEGKFRIFTPITVDGFGFKFLPTLGAWDGDWGMLDGASGVLEQDGEQNVTVAEDGFYMIEVNFVDNIYTVTPMTFGVIGHATANGWDADQDMTHEGGLSFVWSVDITLTDGQIKFRANDDWVHDFGDDGADGSLDYKGANIDVTVGTYTVKMDLTPGAMTYELTAK
ncbi:SusF/SusE family outer membrane protein [Limibacter armeniacum]|uniref:SusF/SusE family outer membrane protein n=1 Tax=Limibacter armeniacum TaxID=466084 RepID=UPI002FE591FC